ncbi:MAG: nucleotide exchange factor GrpE [Anaerolineae bacterium]|nr:nucleotide exchange factor GrpE [Anaerolineae bacterium]
MANKQVKVPIRVKKQESPSQPTPPNSSEIEDASPAVVECPESTPSPVTPLPPTPPEEKPAEIAAELERWRDRALRLEAEIDNFRKRQRRLAEEQIAAERERLLRSFLNVADDLARALAANGGESKGLRTGVDLTYQGLVRLLNLEGVEPIDAAGQPFDPLWHEAVGTVPHQAAGVEPNTVAEVVQPGYCIGERLLRPAHVIVAM